MTTRMWRTERDPDTGMPVQTTPVPTLSVPETQAQEVLDWRRHQLEAKAQEAAEAEALQRRLDVSTVDTYTALGKAISAVTTEEGWIGIDQQVLDLVGARGLSARYGTELRARLMRVARDRRWIRD